MSDILVDEPELAGPGGPLGTNDFEAQLAAETAAERKRLLIIGGILTVVGIALVAFGLAGAAVIMAVRIVATVIGLICLYMGLRRLGLAWRGPDFDLTFILSAIWLAILIFLVIFAGVLPFPKYKAAQGSVPIDQWNLSPHLFSAHPLGTDGAGYDLFAASVFGARPTLLVSIISIVVGVIIGGALGILAGYFGGWIDTVIGVLTNSLLAVPALILLIALGSVFTPATVTSVSLSLALLAIPSMIRIARANTITFAQREFVLAARAMGASRWRVMLRELAPNVALPVMSLAMVLISVMIVAEASLSFLGLSVEGPTWGTMIKAGTDNMRTLQQYPYIALIPSLFLFLTVFAFNVIGEKAQTATSKKGGVKL